MRRKPPRSTLLPNTTLCRSGAAIRNRYKSGSTTPFHDPRLMELLPDALQEEAETLGRALRLGAMLSGAAPGSDRKSVV